MDSSRLATLLDWITAHPVAAGLLVTAVALADALPVAGMLVPSMAILLAVGALLGLGLLDPAWILACAAIGALLGDVLGYLLGRHYGSRLRGLWPFSRYPQWLHSSERLFQRRGAWGVVIGRQVGAVRPFVPAIAGMLGMPPARFMLAAVAGAALWSVAYLAPGWLLGKSWELFSAVAGRLAALLLSGLLLLLASLWATRLLHAWLAPRIGAWLDGLAAWARAHPRSGRAMRGLLDPKAPDSAALMLLTLGLVLATAGAMSLLALPAWQQGVPQWDRQLAALIDKLRHPYADALALWLLPLTTTGFAALSTLPTLLWLAWRRRWLAWTHAAGLWLGALLAALSLQALLGAGPQHAATPAWGLTAGILHASAGWCFFAVLIADEMPRKARGWPYVLATLVMLGVGLPRLYLGLHSVSALCASLLLGAALGLLFGIAYRRHERARLWIQPLRRVQLGGAAMLAVAWLALHPVAERGLPAAASLRTLPSDWRTQVGLLSTQREDFGSARRWPLQLRWLGAPEPLATALQAQGWERLPPATPAQLLGLLDFRAEAAPAPRLPATHGGRAEALLLRRPAIDGGEWQLRLWSTDWQDRDGRRLHVGHIGRFIESRPLGLWRRWQLLGEEAEGYALIAAVLEEHWRSVAPMPRARTAAPPQPSDGSSSSKR